MIIFTFLYLLIVVYQIVESLEPSSKMRNIADLCHALISQTHIQPTLQLYMRIAFLVRLILYSALILSHNVYV